MKKNRLATKLSLLAEADRLEDLIAAVFRETSSIGVRFYPVERRVLEREIRTDHGPGRGYRNQGVPPGVRDRPRPAGVRRLRQGLAKDELPLKEIMRLALKEHEGKGRLRKGAKESRWT